MAVSFAGYKFSQGRICKIFPIQCDSADRIGRKVATVREWPWRGSVLKATLRLSCCQWMTHASVASPPENLTIVYPKILAPSTGLSLSASWGALYLTLPGNIHPIRPPRCLHPSEVAFLTETMLQQKKQSSKRNDWLAQRLNARGCRRCHLGWIYSSW